MAGKVEGEDGRADVCYRQRRRSGVRRKGREGTRADRQGRLPLRGPGDEANALGREAPRPVCDQEGSRPQALRGQASHTTPAHVHDSQVVAPLFNVKDKEKQVYADAGYAGAAQEALVRGFGAIPVFCEKAYRNAPLTDEQKANNRVKSSVRSRIEHVFGFVENSLHGARSRYVGLARNHARHWMLVFCYNLNRLVQLKEYGFRKTLGLPTAPV